MRFSRYATSVMATLAILATTPSALASAVPPDLAVAPQVVDRAARPLPITAVTPVRNRGRWFSIRHRDVRQGVGRAAATGRQSLIRITGPHARQRFAFDVALPAGSYLAMRGDRIAAISRHGTVAGVLDVPWAVDALGVRISTRFELLDRDTFVQVVEHRPVGAVYPVYADPWWVVPVIVREGARQLGRYVVRRSTYEAAKRAAERMASRQSGMDVDDLMAKTPVKLLKLNGRNFRENVRRRTHWQKASIKGYDAHHTLPKKFEGDFNAAGFNIHNPIFGHWWCSSAHRSAAGEFNRRWNKWLRTRRDDITDSNAWRNKIENKRIDLVSTPQWASSYQCP